MVTLLVGTGRFVVHRIFATHYSPVFRAAFSNGGFIESQNSTYVLSETSEQVVALFIHWLYQQTFDNLDILSVMPDPLQGVAEVWILGQFLQIPKMQNQALREFRKLFVECKVLPVSVVEHVYENTLPSSPIRKLIIQMIAFETSSEQWKGSGGDDTQSSIDTALSNEVLVELAVVLKGCITDAACEKMAKRDLSEYDVKEFDIAQHVSRYS